VEVTDGPINIVQVKHGDKVPTYWTVDADTSGASVRLLARRRPIGPLVILTTTVIDASRGMYEHITTGTLDVADYLVEMEITQGDQVVTAPTCGFSILRICKDLG
jgi:hypothetical protein